VRHRNDDFLWVGHPLEPIALNEVSLTALAHVGLLAHVLAFGLTGPDQPFRSASGTLHFWILLSPTASGRPSYTPPDFEQSHATVNKYMVEKLLDCIVVDIVKDIEGLL
jgi:hypothetical protein